MKGKIGLKDILIIVGTVMLFAGIYLIYPPAALITIGAGFIWLGQRGK